MKKVFITLAVVLGMATAANAQLVIGGGVEFGGASSKITRDAGYGDSYKNSSFDFGFTPRIGYIINEKWEVGAGVTLKYNENINFAMVSKGTDPAKAEKASKNLNFSWSINPYARYRLFDVKGFGFWLEGEANLGTSLEGRTKHFAYGVENETNTWQTAQQAKDADKIPDGHKYSKFNGAFHIQPVLTYAINEHWSIESQLYLLSFSISGSVEKTTDKGVDTKGNAADVTITDNTFDWGLGLKQGRYLSLGVVYKF